MDKEEYRAWMDHPLTQKALEEVNSEYLRYSKSLINGAAEAEGRTEANYCRITGYLRGLHFTMEKLPEIIKRREGGKNNE